MALRRNGAARDVIVLTRVEFKSSRRAASLLFLAVFSE